MKRHFINAALVLVLCGIDAAAQGVAQEKFNKFVTRQLSPMTALENTVNSTFWRNPEWIKMLSLSTDQQQKMDDVFQQYRLRLVDLTAALEKEELMLQPLLGTARPSPQDEPRIRTQIDYIANARAELEKANGKMLIDILMILTPEQWTKMPIRSKKTAFFKSGVTFLKK